MPSKHTFTIKPIRALLNRYVGNGANWIDPFAGENSPAEITNDLNPSKPTKYHLHALDFAKMLEGDNYNGVLFDPPYSIQQVKQCYEGIGCEDFMRQDASHFPYDIKRAIAPKITGGGMQFLSAGTVWASVKNSVSILWKSFLYRMAGCTTIP